MVLILKVISELQNYYKGYNTLSGANITKKNKKKKARRFVGAI